MKRIFTILAILFTFSSYSQSVFRPALVIAEDLCSEDEIIGRSTFVNKFSSSTLKFVRIKNTLTTGWTSAYCDCELCRSVEVDSSEFFIGIGDSCTTSTHFYPKDIKGQGTVQVKFFDPLNRSVFVIGEYRATCQSGFMIFLNIEQLKVTPNPATSTLNIQFGSTEPYTISIVSAEGRLVMNEEVSGLNHNIDISQLTAGLYSIRAESSSKVVYTKFIKN